MDLGNYSDNVLQVRSFYDAAREAVYWRNKILPPSGLTPEFIWETRKNELNKQVLYFPAMFISDLHLGTNHSRAKRTAHMLENTATDDLYAVGDIIDLTNWNKLGKWSSQVLAHLFRKQAKFFGGNHEELPETTAACAAEGISRGEWLKQKLYEGWPVYDELEYKDAKGRVIQIMHADQFDDIVFGDRKAMWYAIGDFFHNPLANLDVRVQEITGWDHFSSADRAKRLVKSFINEGLGVEKEIIRALDANSNFDGFKYGHSHEGGIKMTPGGKLLLNTGHCTGHVVQGMMCDRSGTFMFIDKWYKERIDVTEENGSKYTVYFKDMDVEPPTFPPAFVEDDNLVLAKIVLGNALRLAKPKNWEQAAEQLCNSASGDNALSMHAVPIPLQLQLMPSSTVEPYCHIPALKRSAQQPFSQETPKVT